MVEHMKMDGVIARCFELVEKKTGKREIQLSNLCRYVEDMTDRLKVLHHTNMMMVVNYDSLVEFVQQHHTLLEIEESNIGNIVVKLKPDVIADKLKYKLHSEKDVLLLMGVEKGISVAKLMA